MYKIKETIIVEGLYDKIKLSQFVDGVIFVTNGFSVFTNENMQKSIQELGKRTGIVILTDSDSAGFKIRNFVKQLLPEKLVKHAYIPNIEGKEKRKRIGGKEGLLGVEGVSDDVIIEALRASGATIDGENTRVKNNRTITKSDMFNLGLSGTKDSVKMRVLLTKELGLPYKISSNMLLDVINRLLTFDELCELVQNIDKNSDKFC
ncbi:MAG: DUF4093 domain-containing protein [Clostridia bacterium]|nr:DUF4093 domain-containing protein [Clostridia bacterium]